MSAPPPKQILHLSHLSPWPNPSNVLIYYKTLLTHILPPFFSLIYSSHDCQRNLLENKLDYFRTPNWNLFTKFEMKSKLLPRTYKDQHTLASVTLSLQLFNHKVLSHLGSLFLPLTSIWLSPTGCQLSFIPSANNLMSPYSVQETTMGTGD